MAFLVLPARRELDRALLILEINYDVHIVLRLYMVQMGAFTEDWGGSLEGLGDVAGAPFACMIVPTEACSYNLFTT